MRHGSLFSGIGGFDLAAEWMGWENVFHCEWNEFGQKILKHYWPNAISYGDITKTDFSIHRGKIDVLTGGFPCQPYSLAGKRKGKEDERHLWPEMLRAIREISPTYIVGENVYGLVNWNGGLVFNEVQTDLEAQGYEVIPVILPACGVNAPHRRDRVWFVAKNTQCDGCLQRESEEKRSEIWQQRNVGARGVNGICLQKRFIAYSASNRRKRSGQGFEIEKGLQPRPESTGKLEGRFEGLCNAWDATDTNIDIRCERRMHETQSQKTKGHIGSRDTWGGWNSWQNFPTQPPVCSGNDGLSPELDGITFSKWRTESIKAYGNAIVPQIAYRIFRCLELI